MSRGNWADYQSLKGSQVKGELKKINGATRSIQKRKRAKKSVATTSPVAKNLIKIKLNYNFPQSKSNLTVG